MARGLLLLSWIICIYLNVVNGCQLVGIIPGITRPTISIFDVDRGDIYNNEVVGIAGVDNIVQNNVNFGPYISGSITGSTFTLATTAIFEQYEEHETLDTFTLTVTFRCSDGTTQAQVFQIDVQDTNNNSPVFLISDEFDIAIATPLLPGHQITGCQHNIVVRDIDLTTSRIDFVLTGSDLFEIEYDEESSTTAKEFVAILRTSTFIRTLPESVVLTINATDVDATGDPPRSAFATVRITADSDAEFPEEPVFAQPLYTARYTENDTIILDETISLQQGYHDLVDFSLNDEFNANFQIIGNNNDYSLSVTTPLSTDILTRQQIYLVIRADREFTSGATATIVVQLPEEIDLQFERSNYEGLIEDNTLVLSNILLAQGYEGDVSVNVSNGFFSAFREGNTITLSMDPLTQEIINENTFLNLEVVASTDRSSATAVVTLEIVKNDTITPVFQSSIYIGSYNTDIGVNLDQIELIQGFDNTVEIELDGDYSDLFRLNSDGPVSILSVEGSLPLEELGEQTIILTILARKFRTVGASASIFITLPEEIKLEFEQASYEGTITDNVLEMPNIVITQGYENLAVFVNTSNEFFTASHLNNVITISMNPLTEDVIEGNSFLNFQVMASTSRSSASTIVVLQLIKNDTTTPLFDMPLYLGTYTVDGSLNLGQINIIQGYDGTVNVTLDGEHENLFALTTIGPSSTLTTTVIPPALFSERNIALTVIATKPRTVGSTAVISIALPTDRVLQFGATTYRGSYENDVLTIETITLTGYDATVSFSLDGDYEQYFDVSYLDQVLIQLPETLPAAVVLENNFLQLSITASGLNALTTTASLLIEIIKDDISTPVFSQHIYTGAYTDGNIEIQNINLVQGFDSNVTFRLDGENAQYFEFYEVGNGITLTLVNTIPAEVIFNEKGLVFSVLAEKPLTVGAHAAIAITFPSELTEPTVMRFSQNSYIGSLDDGVLSLDNIILNTGYLEGTVFLLTGEYVSYFAHSYTNEIVSITTSDILLPQDVIEENKFIVLEVEATRDRAVSAFSTIIIEIKHVEENPVECVETPVFNEAYYRGSYDLENGLQFTDQVYLVQGYDASVTIDLQGDFSELFSATDNNNSISLMANTIPESVWENNDQLIITILAMKPTSLNGAATILIDFPKEVNETVILGFERSNYVGSLENDIVTIQPITVTEGFSEDVSFTLFGDLNTYFNYSQNEASITLQLSSPIPEESLPTNGIIVLDIQASTTTATLPAVTTVILEVVRDSTPNVEQLVFGQTYYVGTYTASDGVILENPISLAEGFVDGDVTFDLAGDSSIYFAIQEDGNSVSLTLGEAIPPPVVSNNNQLIFTIHAQSLGGATAQATVVILLPNEVDENTTLLGFERSNYVGSLENDIVTIQPITVTEGFSEDVSFTLFGDLNTYFNYSQNEASITLQLSSPIPEESLPNNGIIVLDVQASTTTGTLPAVTTVILEVVRDSTPDVEQLVFGQTYYVGTYTASDGVILENPISLAEGFVDGDVTFDLAGDSSIYFAIQEDGNSVSLTLGEAIPPPVVSNNNQLIFTIHAQSLGGATAQATVVILLPNEVDENTTLLGFERSNYVGSLEHDIVTIQPITVTEGFSEDVSFTLFGDLNTYFNYSQNEASITLQLSSPIPEESLPTNGIIVLDVQASTTTGTLPAVTTVILEVVRDSTPDVEQLVFGQTYYVGTYTASDGVILENPISLAEGFVDGDVTFDLAGDSSIYFAIQEDGNSVSLTLGEAIPPPVVSNNNQLIFTIHAQSLGGATAQATVVILLPNDVDENTTLLGFERSNYVGSLENDIVTIQPITVTEGFSEDVSFTLFGDLNTYFNYSQNEASITLLLSSPIPEESLPNNGIIVLDIQASTTTGTLPAVTTVILEVVRDSTPNVEQLLFGQTYYVGTYTASDGVILENPISLAEGFVDGDVTFDLAGDSSIYFAIQEDGNSVSLTLGEAIPPPVVSNNNQLIFTIHAQSLGGATAEATVVILLPNEVDENTTLLGFERSNYVGSLENDIVTIQPITVTEGFSEDVSFTLFGDLNTYFNYSQNEASITLLLSSPIPEESLPNNGIIVLDIQASNTTGTLPAVTTVILEVVRDSTPDVEQLVFGQTYYVGTYTASDGVILENPISLAEGFVDGDVTFDLAGDSSIYFAIQEDGNSVSLTLGEAIPPPVVSNNNQLIFTIHAQSLGGATAQATVIILLPNDVDENTTLLGFERSNYVGSLENDIVTIQPITVTEGFSEDVSFTLFGDLNTYFNYSQNEASITLQLSSPIPEESLPTNGIIVLDVQASTTTGTLPAVTTVILEVVRDSTPDVEQLVFGQTYYVGTYTASDGVILENPISLAEGFVDGDVTFDLAGDSSIYFAIQEDGNSVSLTLGEAIPPPVVSNNNQLIFTIHAQSLGGATAQATVIILLPNDVDENSTLLGFERSNYVGSLENDIVTIQPITVTERFSEDVSFTLFGDLNTYFNYSQNEASITLQLSSPIPEESLPTNGIIVLDVQASTTTGTLPAVTTVILEVVRDSTPDVEQLVFGQTYYVGTYTASDGVILENPISLAEGFVDGDVTFDLAGDSSIYFAIQEDGNSVSLTLGEAIPPPVVSNNNQLIFTIHAQSLGGATAQATVVILLPNDVDENTTLLGFERSNYVGSLENDIVTIQPITVTEGFSEDVSFTLFGDLNTYFNYSQNEASITLQLSSPIPEESLPTNGIIVLDVQASTTTGTLPAVTTVILEVVRDSTPDVEQLVFGQTYYVGTYTASDGVILENPISLAEGFVDGDVTFDLAGDSSIYFAIQEDGNSLSLTLGEAIPPPVVSNNNQLIFAIHAQSLGGATAQATVVILLPNDVDENTTLLGFERSNYVGSLENDIVTIQPITVTEGFSEDVSFTLFGDLNTYFNYSQNEASITLQLSSPIPEESLPTNGIIVLDVQASTTTGTLPAVTTVILEVVRDSTPDVEQLVFGQTYYVGTYTASDGVILENPISLAEGFVDGDVTFDLAGDSSIYFAIQEDGNSLSLTLGEAIPPPVVSNNNQLIFAIHAQSLGGATAQATVVILLPNDVDENTTLLGFERSNYVGSLENDIVTIQPITVTEGFSEDVSFTLFGDLNTYFNYSQNEASITLQLSSPIPEESLPTNGIIVLDVQASTTTGTLPAVTTVILEVVRDSTPDVEQLVFGQTYYVGTYTASDGVILENPISLAEGFVDGDVTFDLAGDSSIYFAIQEDGNSLSLTLGEAIPPPVVSNNNQLIFAIHAQSLGGATAQATVVILLPNEVDENTTLLGFERSNYVGSLENDIVTIQPITVTEGFSEDVSFTLFGDLNTYFNYSQNEASITLQLSSPIPEESLPTNGIIVLDVQASTTTGTLPAVTTAILEVISTARPDFTVTFSKVLYEGLMQSDLVQHEAITVTGYNGNDIEVRGDYSEMFTATLSEGAVILQRTGSVTLPTDIAHVAVELHVVDAAAVLLLQVYHTDTPNPLPTVTFSSTSYVVHVETLQTGIVGIVTASADNGESLGYSVFIEDAYLATRVMVNNGGELLLSSAVDSGEYIFDVVATTFITQARATATVYLTVVDTSISVAPLIVLDRDEEEPHENLVIFSPEHENCSYTLTNRFPVNQDWLYLDETGLHARVIDREDPSIAFMALSQIQVELEVNCNSVTRNKRFTQESRLDWLGPYDYGTSTWIIGESIDYNPTKTVVNLIVNDINDNAPIFVGRENQPIAVGYPIPELEEIILPRALVELKATDADVGENAALRYWSAEPVLAVSPTTGFVHIRDDTSLEEDQALVVHVTDRNGLGLSDAINLVVKLLDISNIAVVTVHNAFLEDEPSIIANLTESLGYEVKVLRAVIISDVTETIEANTSTRRKRQAAVTGATLEMYVYGLIERVPITAEVLTEDINNSATGVSIAGTVSLEDHLENRQIDSGRDVGLLVATIVLSVLLFILIVANLVWFFLKWRKEKNYDEFSDENSLESRNESIEVPQKLEPRPKPRITIDELKRSERRLQDMIDAPYVDEIIASTSTKEAPAVPVESIIDISQSDSNILIPIVINDKLKDADEESDTDEFGEMPLPRRKSVVTFNENVEKIIHVDDNLEGSSISSDVEIFRL